MLYITFGKYENLERWHIGEGLHLSSSSIQDVIEVRADGDELEHVLHTSIGLPLAPGKKSMRWFGDFAKLIVGNLLVAD